MTAVLVAHDGAGWLPETLSALAAQTRSPDLVAGVDTGSQDSTGRLLARALGTPALVTVPRDTSYGAAVAAGLSAREVPAGVSGTREEWVWLLHDDSAPAPDALERLLDHVRDAPGAVLLGPKIVDWSDPRRLLEVGLTTDGAGRRETGLEPGELDHGQHDAPRDVLAVSTAGALVRRETLQALGGFDRALPLLREDIDFGWRVNLSGGRVSIVPAARVRHARATLTGRRAAGAVIATRRLDRRHALFVLAANASRVMLLPVLALLLAGGLLRSAAFLLTRRPQEARDELAAVFGVFGSPVLLWKARRARAASRQVGGRALRPLFASRTRRLRATMEAVGDWIVAGAAPPSGAGRGLETGPQSDGGDDDLPLEDVSRWRQLLVRPGVALTLALAVLALIADRHLLGGGRLAGGRLLPPPQSAHALWDSYLSSWQPGVAGSASPAPPYLPLLALLGTVLGGSASRAVALLVLFAVPLAGAAAYRAARRVIPGRPTRVWLALGYVFVSGLPAAVAEGRFDVVVAFIAIPGLVAAGIRLLADDPREVGWRRAWALGLQLAVAFAFAPQLALPAAVLLLGGAVGALLFSTPASRASARRRALGGLIAVLAPALLLLPTTLSILRHPGLLLTGFGTAGGLAGAAGPAPGAADLLLLHPVGAPGLPSGWIAAPVLLAALVGLMRLDVRRVAVLGWSIATVGYATALVDSRVSVVPGYGFPGVGLAVAAAGLLLAAGAAAHRARATLARRAFGWRQLGAGVLATAALAAPVVAAGAVLMRGAGNPLVRSHPTVLPAFALDDARLDTGERVLVLQAFGAPAGRTADQVAVVPELVLYSLGPASGQVLGGGDAYTPPAVARLLAQVVSGLSAPLGTDAGRVLATFHVRYVAVPAAPGANAAAVQELAAALDSQPVLSRVTSPPQSLLWRVTVPSARLQLLSDPLAALAEAPAGPTADVGRGPSSEALAAAPPQVEPAGRQGARVSVAPGAAGRLLVLSEARDSGWQARLDGRLLPTATVWGWAQAFVVPAAGGTVVISHDGTPRNLELAAQGLALLVVLVLAAPSVGGGATAELIGHDSQPAADQPGRVRAGSRPEALV
ncbi:MAG: glycosyltransferase family 2 protein [Mycobacteriales bacterium]